MLNRKERVWNLEDKVHLTCTELTSFLKLDVNIVRTNGCFGVINLTLSMLRF